MRAVFSSFGVMALLVVVAPLHASAEGRWITDGRAVEADRAAAPIVLQFRRELSLNERPQSFRVRVSADQRFVLFVNGARVGAGPARGNLKHWRYEILDLAPFLQPGDNVIAAQVWSDGKAAAFAQVTSGRTAFWLSAERADHARLVDTGPAWRVRIDPSRSTESGMTQLLRLYGPTFYAAAPAETFSGVLLSPHWNEREPGVGEWRSAIALTPKQALAWTLVPDALPQMRYERLTDAVRVVRARGVEAEHFPRGAVAVPAHTEASILLDAGRVLSLYSALAVKGGAGAKVEVSYVESLYDPAAKPARTTDPPRVRFADRSAVANGQAIGLTDTFLPAGAVEQRFQPFWWRTWRFAEIKIQTADQPLTLTGFDIWETGYPFEQRGRFVSNDPELNAIYDIGWRTALIDAHETYMDSSYWEQLQYVGDTRLQMQISYDVAGDPRLAVQALEATDHSRIGDELPRSQAPSVFDQTIPPFALLWIGSLHDYWMRQPDTSVLSRSIAGTRAVLDYFGRYVEASGLVGPMPMKDWHGWMFIDWKPGLDHSEERDKGIGVRSCIVTMQYVGALREAADLERAFGDAGRAEKYLGQVARTIEGLNSQCWDEQRGLYANTPERKQFSQHAAALAVLHDIAPREQHRTLLERVTLRNQGIEAPDGITASTYYFSFYLARAFEHAGLADRYLELLESWRSMVKRNFTAWPESPDPSRSDTHAWSAHPTTGLTEYIAGIKPDAPGFARVRIEPHLGELESVDAAVAHPRGLIEAMYSLRQGTLTAVITLPENTAGTFEWAGQTRALVPGRNGITLTAPSQ